LLAIGTAAYDRARTCIILLVLVHHSILPYTHDGRSNHESFLGFDAVAAFNDSFMAAMFLLSGLFVWPSLRHKGIAGFLRDRWWRLGFPFAIAALILMPIAYYADEIRRHDLDFAAYWWKTVTVGPWHSGPAWFIGALLVFDVLAAIVYRAAPILVEAIGELSL
jgi:Acyltransferase family